MLQPNPYESPKAKLILFSPAVIMAGSVPTDYNDGSVSGIEDIYDL